MKLRLLFPILLAVAFFSSHCTDSEPKTNVEQCFTAADVEQAKKDAVNEYKFKLEQERKKLQDVENEKTDSLLGTELKKLNLSTLGIGALNMKPSALRNWGKNSSELKVTDVRDFAGWVLGLNESQMTLAASNPASLTKSLEQNLPAIKSILLASNLYAPAKKLYEKEKSWADNTKPVAKEFETFFKKWGQLQFFPYKGDGNDKRAAEFDADMKKIISQYPNEFSGKGWDNVPLEYNDWLFVKRWKERLGSNFQTVLDLARKLFG